MPVVLFVLILNVLSSGHATETGHATAEKPWKVYTEWPFSVPEARRRQEETAKALGLARRVKKRIRPVSLGKYVFLWLSCCESHRGF